MSDRQILANQCCGLFFCLQSYLVTELSNLLILAGQINDSLPDHFKDGSSKQGYMTALGLVVFARVPV